MKATDAKNIWHPLTQHKTHPDVLPIAKAKGALLYDTDGNPYIDGIASWYTCMYGHCNPYIIDKVYAQMQQLDQIVFSGFTHRPAVELSEKLLSILPNNQAKLFFSDNGSTATEVGIKMALQYHFNQGRERHTILAFEEAFHGDTFGAMSASGLSVYNGPFEKHFIDIERIPVPTVDTVAEILLQLEKIHQQKPLAGFIYEPLVQGAAGMKMYDAAAIAPILAFCKEHHIITIADEVMTGFGKTGTLFASEQISPQPDVICLSKALTAGMLPMAITTCAQYIYDAFYSNDMGKGLFHAHTYTANPLACTAASAGIDLLLSEEIKAQRQFIRQSHLQFKKILEEDNKAHHYFKNIRVKGVILALELTQQMERYGSMRDQLFAHFKASGVFLRPLGNTIYILPPYVISAEQLQQVYSAIKNVVTLFD